MPVAGTAGLLRERKVVPAPAASGVAVFVRFGALPTHKVDHAAEDS
jgi:hypothetical protein